MVLSFAGFLDSNQASGWASAPVAQVLSNEGLTPSRSPNTRQKPPVDTSIASRRIFETTGTSQKDRNVYPDGTTEPMKGAYRSVALSYQQALVQTKVG